MSPEQIGSEALSPDEQALQALYQQFTDAHLLPLWTQRADLMPEEPQPRALAHRWIWSDLIAIASTAGDLVPVGRGGERRAIALANPGLDGRPYATPTLWAAVQYLGPGEAAPAHRHSQTAFRFIVQGEGVWTNVDGDPVAMREGDLLLTPAWCFHEHHNTTEHAMAWLDGLDIPLVSKLDAGFFEYGPSELTTHETPERSRSERLWAHPGLQPVASLNPCESPLLAFRWAATDAALSEQLNLEYEGYTVAPEDGHAIVRFSNPATGQDALRTIRTEMHRMRAGASTASRRTVGSSVWQVFRGTATVDLGDLTFDLKQGDLFVVPSWTPVVLHAHEETDFFRFSDEPVYELLGLSRVLIQERNQS